MQPSGGTLVVTDPIDHHLVQPAAKLPVVRQLRPTAPSHQEDLLDDVLCRGRRAGQPLGHPQQVGRVRIKQVTNV